VSKKSQDNSFLEEYNTKLYEAKKNQKIFTAQANNGSSKSRMEERR
jgi:hypothetical protein